MIQSDQGSNFTSHLFGQVLKQLKVKHTLASAYHAQSQGALERFHQTLKSFAACVLHRDRGRLRGRPTLVDVVSPRSCSGEHWV